MRKFYVITSIPNYAKDQVISGLVANGTGREATPEELAAIIELLRTKGASETLLDALREGTYPNPVAVFERRAAARKEAKLLNDCGSCFDWAVLELGESVRQPVRKPLGWRLLLGTTPSAFNRDYGKTDAGGERVVVDHADQFGGDQDANYLFRTRELGRALIAAEGLSTDSYELVPVYADA